MPTRMRSRIGRHERGGAYEAPRNRAQGGSQGYRDRLGGNVGTSNEYTTTAYELAQRARGNRQHCLVADVLRGNSTPDDGFSLRIFERMRREDARMEQGYDPLAGIE